MRRGLELRRFAQDSAYNFVRQMWSIGLGMAISILLARGLGTEARGMFTLAILLPDLMVKFLNLGVGPATVYYVGRSERELAAVVRGNMALGLWVSAVSILLGYGVIHGFGAWLFPGVPSQLLLFSLIIIPVSLYNSYLLVILQGLQDFRAFNLVGLAPQLVTLVLILLLVWWYPWGVMGALVAQVGGGLTALSMLVLLLGRRCRTWRIFTPWIDRSYTRQALTYGLKAHFANIVAFLNYRADMFLLNFFVGPALVGIYSISVSLGEKLWILSGAVGTTMLPRIASLEGDESARKRLTPLIARHVLGASLAAAIFIWLFSEWFVVLLYSAEFQPAAAVLRVLLPGIVLLSVSKILSNDIAGRGRPEINSYQSAGAFVVNVVANLVLIPYWGAKGAALATSISYSLLTIIKIISYCRMTGAPWHEIIFLKPTDFGRLRMVARSYVKQKRTERPMSVGLQEDK